MMNLLLLTSLAAVSHLPAPDAKTFTFKDRQGASVQVSLNVATEESRTGLQIQTSRKWNDETFTTERTEWYKQPFAPKVDFFLPVRVAGLAEPMVVARVTRANWTDYLLFSVSASDVRKAFSYSCRETNTIVWKAKKGQLWEIITYDKFEPVPVHLRKRELGSQRWMLVTTWKCNSRDQLWGKASSKWASYDSQEGLPGTSEVLPSKFTFRW